MQAVKLLQQILPVLNWGCQLMQVVLYSGATVPSCDVDYLYTVQFRLIFQQ